MAISETTSEYRYCSTLHKVHIGAIGLHAWSTTVGVLSFVEVRKFPATFCTSFIYLHAWDNCCCAFICIKSKKNITDNTQYRKYNNWYNTDISYTQDIESGIFLASIAILLQISF